MKQDFRRDFASEFHAAGDHRPAEKVTIVVLGELEKILELAQQNES